MKRSAADLIGEFLRETGVLVVVFYGLAALLSGGERTRLPLAFASMALGLFSWSVGVWVERRRAG